MVEIPTWGRVKKIPTSFMDVPIQIFRKKIKQEKYLLKNTSAQGTCFHKLTANASSG